MPEADDLRLLVDAAREAGRIAMSYRGQARSWAKDDASPVSEADLAVNEALEAVLRGSRPGYGWLSEESADTGERLRQERVFILDPIDGTRAYLDGHGHFAHAIAVAEGGRVTTGVVYLPAEDLLYTATFDGPAMLNGRVITTSDRAGVEGARVLTSRRSLAPEHWRAGQPPPIRHVFRSSLAYRLCLVAEGRFEAMMTLQPAWEWDIAAGALIAERAGATVTDRRGTVPTFNRPDARADGLIAANGLLWRALQAGLVQQADPRATQHDEV